MTMKGYNAHDCSTPPRWCEVCKTHIKVGGKGHAWTRHVASHEKVSCGACGARFSKTRQREHKCKGSKAERPPKKFRVRAPNVSVGQRRNYWTAYEAYSKYCEENPDEGDGTLKGWCEEVQPNVGVADMTRWKSELRLDDSQCFKRVCFVFKVLCFQKHW